MAAPGTMTMIIASTASYFGVEAEEIRNRCGRREVAHARQAVIWLARRLTDLSYPQIARAFGELDHTTAVYAVRAVDERRAADRHLAAGLDALENRLRRLLEKRANDRSWERALQAAARQAVTEAAEAALDRVKEAARRDPMGVLAKLGRIEALPAHAGGIEDEDATRL